LITKFDIRESITVIEAELSMIFELVPLDFMGNSKRGSE